MKIADVYTKKEYECKKCNSKIYYAKITDDSGNIYTVDGLMPNGKYGRESNVISGAVDVNVKDRLHECTKHYVEDAVAKAPPAPGSGGTLPGTAKREVTSLQEQEIIGFTEIVERNVDRLILVEDICRQRGITNPAQIGMVYNKSLEIVIAQIKGDN